MQQAVYRSQETGDVMNNSLLKLALGNGIKAEHVYRHVFVPAAPPSVASFGPGLHSYTSTFKRLSIKGKGKKLPVEIILHLPLSNKNISFLRDAAKSKKTMKMEILSGQDHKLRFMAKVISVRKERRRDEVKIVMYMLPSSETSVPSVAKDL